MTQQHAPLPRGLFLFLALLAATGAGMAGYLTHIHYALQRADFLTIPGCSGAGLFNCHLVSLSTHAVVAGRPLAAWGTLLYGLWVIFAIVGLAGTSTHQAAAARLVFATALAAVAVDGYLAWVMLAQIHAICVWCLATYGVNLLVLVLAWFLVGRSRAVGGGAVWLVNPLARPPAGEPRMVPALVAGWCASLVFGVWGVAALLELAAHGNVQEMHDQLRRYRQEQPAAQIIVGSSPSHGAAAPRVTIVEFSDFFCPACQKGSKVAQSLVANHPRDVQVVFKHYPLDQACNPHVQRMVHPNACRLAVATTCAQQQGKFWELHDRIFLTGPEYHVDRLESDAQQVGVDVAQWRACLDGGQGLALVKQDIEQAHQLNVQSTPTFFVNGYLFGGVVPPAVFEVIVQDFLAPPADASPSHAAPVAPSH